jgi:RsmE family RNA methyltransferase
VTYVGGIERIPEIVADRKIIASTKIDSLTIKNYLKQNTTGSIAYVIGPEGDFTTQELEFFTKIGFEGISIHDNILRSELAKNEYVASILSYEGL